MGVSDVERVVFWTIEDAGPYKKQYTNIQPVILSFCY